MEMALFAFGSAVKLMRTCKQIEQECAMVLYGENKYTFDTRGHLYERASNGRDALDKMSWGIPGLPDKITGKQPSEIKLARIFDKLFDRNRYHPTFIYKDLFIRFIMEIGRRNTSFLKDIQIEGIFKTRQKDYLAFNKLLPIYTVILRELCPVLRKLILHSNDKGQFPRPLMNWENDLKDESTNSDDDGVDEMVGMVVEGLPHLQELQLDSYRKVPSDKRPNRAYTGRNTRNEDEWGTSITWMTFVQDRHRKQLAGVDVHVAHESHHCKIGVPQVRVDDWAVLVDRVVEKVEIQAKLKKSKI